MIVYQGEEVVIKVAKRADKPEVGVVWINSGVKLVNGDLCAINWIDKDKFISELTAVIDKYKI